MVELVFEKHMQNRLLGVNLSAIAKAYLTPEQVRWELAKANPRLHTAITTYLYDDSGPPASASSCWPWPVSAVRAYPCRTC
jgi:hypothetical protein